METISNIFKENCLSLNKEFHLVNDKFPICNNHIFALSTAQNKAICHHPIAEFEQLLIDVKKYLKEPFYFFEKGNASFCTSFDGPICGHIHFLPKKYFKKETIKNLKQITQANQTSYPVDVTNEEYFLFGDVETIFYSDHIKRPEKRFLRNYFTNNKNE